MTAPAQPSHGSKRFFSTLDGIRGLAAILVAMSHTLVFLAPLTLTEAHLAVDVFFLLSGVVLANAYEQRLLAGSGAWRFVVIRAIRIYPLYLLGCLITVATLESGFGPQDDAGHVFLLICLALFILPNPFLGNDHVFPLNGPSWSLFFELIANIAYAAFIRSLTTAHLLGIMFISALGIALGLYLGHTHTLNIGWTLKGLPFGLFRVGYSFFGGVLLYRVFRSGYLPVNCPNSIRPWAPLLLFAIVATVLTYSPPAALVPYVQLGLVTIVFPVVVYLSLWFEPTGRTAHVFTFLGAISYPLYALHFPISQFIQEYFKQAISTPVQAYAPYGGVCLILSLVACSWTLDKAYDGPVRRALTKRLTQPDCRRRRHIRTSAWMAHSCLLRRFSQVLFARKVASNEQWCEEDSMPDEGSQNRKHVAKPTTCYIICSSPRSGSTLLAQALRDMGIGHPGEYLNQSLLDRMDWGDREMFMKPSPMAYVERLKETRTVNGVFGLKTHYMDLTRYPEIADRIGTLFPDAKYISITRRNVLRQAISAAKAAQTMAWTSHLEQRQQARFNFFAVLKNIIVTVREIEWWDNFFARHGIKPLRIVYEDLDEDYEGTLRKVIRFLGAEGTIPPPPLKKQADGQTEAWVEEFAKYFRRRAAIGWAVRLVSRRW